MTEREKMERGLLYSNLDRELTSLMLKARLFNKNYNELSPMQDKEKHNLLKNHLGSVGANISIEQPFYCDYGCNIYISDNFYANIGFTVQDSGKVHIGNNCFIGPNVSIFTAQHPLDAKTRNSHCEYAYPVTIGDSVWIGGGCIINPGVTIGSNVVIGSGSIVTRDIPDNSLALGSPCRVIKSLANSPQ